MFIGRERSGQIIEIVKEILEFAVVGGDEIKTINVKNIPYNRRYVR